MGYHSLCCARSRVSNSRGRSVAEREGDGVVCASRPPYDLSSISVQGRCFQDIALQPDLDGLAAQVLVECIRRLIQAINRQKFGLQLAAEDPGLCVAHRTCNGSPP